MKRLLLLLTLLLSLQTFAQNNSLSIEANAILPVGNHFISKSYNGIADLGIQYRVYEKNKFRFITGINTSFLKSNNNPINNNNPYRVKTFIFQPSFIVEYSPFNRVKTSLGIGYSWFHYRFKIKQVSSIYPICIIPGPDNQHGLNINLRLRYDLSRRLFVQTQYGFSKLFLDQDILKKPYNNRIHILKLGFGYRLL
jgi:hypothetical protein